MSMSSGWIGSVDVAIERGNMLEREEYGDADDQAGECTEGGNAGGFAKDHGGDLRIAEAVDAQDGDLANTREDRHDHGVGDAESAKDKAASADGPRGGFENFELGVGVLELSVFEGDEVGVVLLDLRFECGGVLFAAQLDGDDGGAVFVKEALRGGERHEDAAIFEAIGGLQNSDDVEGAMADGDAAADGGVEEVGRAGAEHDVVIAFAEVDAIAGEPRCFADARIAWRDAEAGDDGVVGAGDDAEENGIGVRNRGPGRDFAGDRCGDVAEEKIGDVAFEDDDFAIARKDAGEHADRALEDGDHSEHGGDAEKAIPAMLMNERMRCRRRLVRINLRKIMTAFSRFPPRPFRRRCR